MGLLATAMLRFLRRLAGAFGTWQTTPNDGLPFGEGVR